jgi:predicted ATPase/class 3 adenylate cyclase/DNA-binding CsgD family transcriptional regulator
MFASRHARIMEGVSEYSHRAGVPIVRWGVPVVSTSASQPERTLVPVGTVTLLLADIEGSVAGWEYDPAAAAEVLARYDGMITETVAAHRGVRPLEQGQGDSFVAAFPRCSDAVAAAVSLQRTLQRPGSQTPLWVRIALHTGEVDVRDGSQYIGHTVHRAARVRDLAHGGQVVVTEATRNLLQDQSVEGVSLTDLGEHRLRDLARPERLFQVRADGLRADFPPLESVDANPNNLPSPLTSFVGRERELEVLMGLVEANRLVTVAGVGGGGKTRLVVQCAGLLSSRFTSGTWFVHLARLLPSASPADALRQVLNISLSGWTDPADAIVEHLRSRTALVVLDNCEHVVQGAAELAQRIAHDCPNVRVLTTTREPLGVDGEVVWRLSPLAVPDDDVSLAAAADVDAVALFVDRARAARPTFALTGATLGPIVAICRRVDGLALAIELAAARVRILSVQTIAAGLDDYFRMLAGGSRTALPRQQTLHASLQWSYDLLSPVEQAVFRRLAVFVGTFDLAAVEATGAAHPVDGVFEVLCSLTDRSLVADAEGGQPGRYRLLEPVREYARTMLSAAGEVEDTLDRVVRHYRSWRSRAEAPRGRTVHEVEVEHPNLLAALEAAAAADSVDDVATLAVSLFEYWSFAGIFDEPDRWFSWVLDRQDRIEARRLVQVLVWDARTRMDHDEPGLALERVEQAVRVATELHDARYDALARFARSDILHATGKLANAITDLEAVVALSDAVPPGLRVQQVAQLALYYGNSGNTAKGRKLLHEAMSQQTDVDPVSAIILLTRQASLALGAADLPDARRAASEALDIARVIDSPTRLLDPLIVAASVASAAGDWEAAERLLEEAGSMAREIGSRRHRQVKHFLAWLALDRGDVERARAAFSEVEAMLAGAEHPAEFLDTARREIALLSGEPDDHATERWVPPVEAALLSRRLLLFVARGRQRGDVGPAIGICHDALEQAVSHDAVRSVISFLRTLGCALVWSGSAVEGVRILAASDAATSSRELRPLYVEAVEADGARTDGRGELGAGFERVWRGGHALSLDEAVELARRGRGKRGRPRSGWDSLTPVELQVAELVAEGCSNPAISERLFISRATVKTHVAHLFTKLGVTSRAELASMVTARR